MTTARAASINNGGGKERDIMSYLQGQNQYPKFTASHDEDDGSSRPLSRSKNRCRDMTLVLVGVLIAFALMAIVSEKGDIVVASVKSLKNATMTNESAVDTLVVETTTVTPSATPADATTRMDYFQVPQAVRNLPEASPVQPISDPSQLVARIAAARDKVFAKLKLDYGSETFENMFLTENKTKGLLVLNPPTPLSTARMIRKMKIKLLQALLTSNKIPTFVWSSGGHSAAASHGNFYNQSYPIYMEYAAKPIFAAVGIALEGRNYAFGSAQSAPELSLCSEAIFGVDADVISWDFGMTDGRGQFFMTNFLARAAGNPNRPALVLIPQGQTGARHNRLKTFEDLGIAGFHLDDGAIKRHAVSQIPETLGKTGEEIAAMPPYVRAFKCKGRLEDGHDLCKTAKWDHSYCIARSFKTSWHPGWKWHALHGNMMAMFLLDMLMDAAKEIQANVEPDLAAWLARLQAEEIADYSLFHTAEFNVSEDGKNPGYFHAMLREPRGYNLGRVVYAEMTYRHPLICHTAWTPSDSRFKGILNGDNIPVEPFTLEQQLVDKTLTADALLANGPTAAKSFQWRLEGGQFNGNTITSQAPAVNSTQMRMGAEMKERQACPVLLNLDHRDYFFVHQREGWRELTLPNKAEQAHYNPRNLQPWGIIAFCHQLMGENSRQRVDGGDQIGNGRLSIQVNGVAATGLANWAISVSSYTSPCWYLQGHNETVFFPPNDEGVFQIKVRVNRPGEYIKMSNWITWYKPY